MERELVLTPHCEFLVYEFQVTDTNSSHFFPKPFLYYSVDLFVAVDSTQNLQLDLM